MRYSTLISLAVFGVIFSSTPVFGQAIVHDAELTTERAKTTALQELNYETAVKVREIVRAKLKLLGRKTESLTTVREYQEMLSRGELSVLGDTVTEWSKYSNPCESSKGAKTACSTIDSVTTGVRNVINARIIEGVVERPLMEANYKLFSTTDEARNALTRLALSQLPGFNPELQKVEQAAIENQADAALRAEERARAIAQLVEEVQEAEQLNSKPISSGRAVQITTFGKLINAMALLESTREHVRTVRMRAFETAKKVARMGRENEASSLTMF